MPNNLEQDKIKAIIVLHRANFSIRQIGRLLGIDRKTVRKHVVESVRSEGLDMERNSFRGFRRSPQQQCIDNHQEILHCLQKGLNAKQIHLHLTDRFGYEGSYWTVNRYVKTISESGNSTAEPIVEE